MATQISNDEATRDEYTATASQTTFPYTFWVRDEDHIDVYVNGTLKTLTTDYTVSAVQQGNGADIVFTSGLTLNDEVVIVLNPDIERTADYQTSGDFKATTVNLEFAYLVSLFQWLRTSIDRKFGFADSVSNAAALEIPTTVGQGGKVLAVNANETAMQWVNQDEGTVVNLNDDQVTTAKIADNAVTTAKINNDAVTTAKIADSNITKAKIEDVANLKVLGNLSGSAAAPSEVGVLNSGESTTSDDSRLGTWAFIKGYVDSLSRLGVGQTWSDVSGSRAFGTTYTNSTGRPIQVSITISHAVSDSTDFLIGGSIVASGTAGAQTGEKTTYCHIIPNGQTYRVNITLGGPTISQWWELS